MLPWPKAAAEALTRRWPVLLLALGVLLAYANAFDAAFQFDDWDVLVEEPRVHSLAAWWDSMPGMRPLLKLSYALDHAAGGTPAIFHRANVLIHLANVLLVLWLVQQLATRSGRLPREAAIIAITTATIFALHPVQTEAVTYVSGRSTSLSTGLALAGIAVWLAWRGRLAVTVSVVLMLAAIAVKETAVVMPAALLLCRAFARESPPRPIAAHWLTLVVAVVALLLLPAYQRFFASSLATRSLADNLVAQVDAVGWLIGQLIRFDRLNADPALVPVAALDPGSAAFSIALLALIVAALIGWRRAPLAAFAVLWTVLWLLPTNSLIARLDLVNERQWYGALLGPALLAGLVLARWSAQSPRLAIAAIAVLALGLGAATHFRNRVYASEIAFWSDVVAKSPHNARAYNNLGIAYQADCRLEDAGEAYRRALMLQPNFVRAAVNLKLIADGPPATGCAP